MESIWSKTCSFPKREPLSQDISTEVAVIGAGITGILTAYLLQKAGKKVVVLEANRMASGQTRNTTAKITSQHGLIYTNLLHTLGKEKAWQYAQANETAIRTYQDLIAAEQIHCDFVKTNAYVYSNDKARLLEEVHSAVSLGLPATFTESLPLPVSAAGAVCFAEQAQFHPLKFLKPLTESLTIYERTPVSTVKEHTLITPKGNVTAEHIIFATHYPFINFPGLYFARMHQERSYVLALENTPLTEGMFIGNDENACSFRTYGNLLLFGGEAHRTGQNKQGGRYDTLRKKAKALFPNCREVAHWSAQDCIPADGVPFIGQYAAGKPHWYVATGFQKWGMTTAMVSATLLRDSICGIKNPFAEVFDPSRFSAELLSGVTCESKESIKGLSKRFFQVPDAEAKELPFGHGGIVTVDDEKVGVYKDETGKLHLVDIRCPHLGCQLEWNPDEKSWDCPCHGSRFDAYGKLISGPAQENITLSF